MGSTWFFFFGSRRCSLDNRWVVKGETWKIQWKICGRDAFKSLQVSSGMREQKFGEFFNCSDYCFQCWGKSLNPNATHRTHLSYRKVGDWFRRGTSHIGVYNSEGTSDSALSLFEPPFLNKWPAVAMQVAVTWCFLWHFDWRNQVQACQQVWRGICHNIWIVACFYHG